MAIGVTWTAQGLALNKQPIDEVIDHALGDEVLEADSFAPTFNASSDGASHIVAEVDAPSQVKVRAIGTEPEITEFKDGRKREYFWLQFASGTSIPEELVQDLKNTRQDSRLLYTVNKLIEYIRAGVRGIQDPWVVAWWLLANGTTYAWGDAVLPNGQPFWSQAHPYIHSNATVSNLAAAWEAPNKGTIRKYVRQLRHRENSMGQILNLGQQLEMITSSLNIDQFDLHELFTSRGDVKDAANEDVNPIKRDGRYGTWSGTGLREWLHMGENESWFLCPAGKRPVKRGIREKLFTGKLYREKARIHEVWAIERIGLVPQDYLEHQAIIK